MASTKAAGAAGTLFNLLNAPDKDIGLADTKATQVMQISLARETVQEMQKAVKAGKALQLSFGKSPTLSFGSVSKPLQVTPLVYRKELYRPSETAGEQNLEFAGLVSHSVALEKMKQDTTGTDEALAKLKANLAGYQKDKEANKATLIDKEETQRLNARNKKSAAKLSHSRNRSLQQALSYPSSPHYSPNALGTPNHSLHPPKSVPDLAMDTPEDRAKRQSIMQVLAIKPTNIDEIQDKTLLNHASIRIFLAKVADKKHNDETLWELRPRFFKEVSFFDWNDYSDEERESAVQNGIKAFDRLRLGRDDPLWQTLLPLEKRGKGIVLSKLNLHHGMLNAGAAPESSMSQLANSNHRAMLKNAGGEMPSTSKSPESGTAKKQNEREREKRLLAKAQGKSVKSRQETPQPTKKNASNGKETPQPHKEKTEAKPTPKDKNSKIKSAEFVHDSDSEDVPLAETTTKKEVTPEQKSITPAKEPQKKPGPPQKPKVNRANFSNEKSEEEGSSDLEEFLSLSRNASNAASPVVKPKSTTKGTKRKSSDDSNDQPTKKARPDIKTAPKETTNLKALKEEETAAWQHYWEVRVKMERQYPQCGDALMREGWRRFDAASAITSRIMQVTGETGRNPAASLNLKNDDRKALEKKVMEKHTKYEGLVKGVKEGEAGKEKELKKLDGELGDLATIM